MCIRSRVRVTAPPSRLGAPFLPFFVHFDERRVGVDFACRHKLSYYDEMAMTSLNISLPEALKTYIEGQVASGDWGTPSEFVRELIRQDKERRLGNLEQELVAAAKGPKIELPVAEIRKKGLLSALRERAHRDCA